MVSEDGRVVRLAVSICGVYMSFLVWGYLQERLSSTDYNITVPEENRLPYAAKWEFVIVLNFCMAFTCALTVTPFVLYQNISSIGKRGILPSLMPSRDLAPAALSNCLASPFGYFSLRYINYPMLLLAKSSKLVPVMLCSYILNGKRYSISQIMSVALISFGVALFSSKKNPISFFSALITAGESKSTTESSEDAMNTTIGLCLVSINLLMDGFTNARQDKFKQQRKDTTSFTMMYQMNILQVVFLGTYLVTEFFLVESGYLPVKESEILKAIVFALKFQSVAKDVALFCITGALGQLFLFYIITEFGSLMCVLITVTRKFFSILLSVVIYRHNVQWWQWIGVASVFVGLIGNSFEKYLAKKKQKKKIE